MGELVCIGSCSGKLYALDRADGRTRWVQDVRPSGRPTSFHGDPLVTDSLILIGSDGGTPANTLNHVWAFDHHGTVRWKTLLQGGVVSDIVRAGDRVLVTTRTDSVLCMDLASGRRLWSFAADGQASEEDFLYRSPAVAGNRVFAGDREGRVHALSVESGRVLWTSEPGPISTGILALGDEIVLADAAGVLRRFEQASGKLRGSIALGHAFKGPPVSLGAGRLLVSGDRAIACVDLRAGRVVWKREMRISSSRPYVRGGAVLAATPQGELIAFRVADGLPLWTRSFQGTIHGIGYDDRTLYIGTEEGMVHAYRRGMAR